MKLIISLSIIFLSCFIITNNIEAKCKMIKYIVRGAVKSAKTSRPVGKAQVFIFFDENESTFAEGYITKYPDFFFTSQFGVYESNAFFKPEETYTILGGEKCRDGQPEIVEILIVKEGFLSMRKRFSGNKLKIINEKQEKIILVPDILLYER